MSEERDDLVGQSPGGGAPTDESMMDMDALMASYGMAETGPELRVRDLVTGTIVQIADDGVMVDVGAKSEGLIPRAELDDIRDQIKVGDQIQVVVAHIDGEDIYLSKRQADIEAEWDRLDQQQHEEIILEARVEDAVRGGLLVDLGDFGQGFVPASHVSVRRPRSLNHYIGQTLRLQVIEVERRRRRVVLSHRLVMEREREAARDVTLEHLREGQVRHGSVRRITEFGAFVDLGGVDGLLHVSELSWKRVASPRDELEVGAPIDVMVLRLNKGEGRISLGRRQLLADPWRDIPRMYREGQTVRGKVIAFFDDGARAVVSLPIGWDVEAELPDELRTLHAAPAAEEAPVAEAPVDEVPTAEVPVDEALTAEAPAVEVAVEAAPDAPAAADASEIVEPVAVEPAAEVAVPAESAPVDESPAAEAAEAAEAVATEPTTQALVIGAEVELRIERVNAPERDLQVSFATSRAISDRGRGRLSDAERGRAPLARGRYSDRRTDEGEFEGEGGDQRSTRDRRERRRDRDFDRDREAAPIEQLSTAPIRRTLGDLMGDQLRSLFAKTDDKQAADSDAAEESPSEKE